MILLYNTNTDEPMFPGVPSPYDRGNLKKFNNYDILRYSLATSAACTAWTKIILTITLDNEYKEKQDEMENI